MCAQPSANDRETRPRPELRYDVRVASERTARAFVLAMGIAGAVSAALLPRPAYACTCPEQGGYALWPLAGAVDVPVDTPLVFARYNLSGSTEAVGYALVGPDGREVALIETGRLPAAYIGCDARETLFLRPRNALEAHTEYRLAARADIDLSGEYAAPFTTSAERASPEPAIEATLDYLQVTTGSCEHENCLALAEALVTLEVNPEAPRWLVVDSAAIEHAHNAHVFTPNAESSDPPAWQLSVTLPRIDPCIDVALYGVEGRVLWEQRRCEPNRCARTDAATFNFCGGPPFSGIRAVDIAVGSCDAPPTIEQGAPPEEPPASDASGCRASAPGTRQSPNALALAVAGLLVLGGLRRGRSSHEKNRRPPRSRPS